MARAQACVSVEATPAQVSLWQVGVVTERVRVPIVSQVLAKPPHALQAPYVGAPQESPSVGRVHASVSIEGVIEQAPPVQSGVATVRDRVPVVSQAAAKPPQAPQTP